MGTYTTNKNLFMPTVGEQGWGTLVNNNFSTIDNFLKPITVSGSTYTFTGNHVGNQSGGSVSATSITNSGTLTQTGTSTFTGKITANGGIGTTALTTSSTITSTGVINANGGVKGGAISGTTGTFSGTVTANKFVYSSAITVTSSSNSVDLDGGCFITLLPPGSSIRYTGSVKYNAMGASTATFRVVADNGTVSTVTLSGLSDTTYSFTKIRALYVFNGMGAREYPKIYIPLIN